MLAVERVNAEVSLALSSAWAAHQLLTGASDFDLYRPGYFLLVTMDVPERGFGAIAAIGALGSILGLLLCVVGFLWQCGMVFRCLGLALSGVFWAAMGTSFLIGNPSTVAGVPLLFLGLSAWWILIRFPTVLGPVAAPR
jgi:hypothetical protein